MWSAAAQLKVGNHAVLVVGLGVVVIPRHSLLDLSDSMLPLDLVVMAVDSEAAMAVEDSGEVTAVTVATGRVVVLDIRAVATDLVDLPLTPHLDLVVGGMLALVVAGTTAIEA